MAPETPIYDLTLLLATDAPEETRAKVRSDIETAIQSGGGSLIGRSALGTRNLAYHIDRHTDAEFHLIQFTGPAELLTELGHSLHITDAVLRFRIIKAIPGSRIEPQREPVAAAVSSTEAPEVP